MNGPEPVLPERSRDDEDRGWGEDLEGAGRDRDEEFRRERPPHHEG
ncbi:MAG: hypothetical protein ACT4QF_18755 [Sporichthyaceae bacterium]